MSTIQEWSWSCNNDESNLLLESAHQFCSVVDDSSSAALSPQPQDGIDVPAVHDNYRLGSANSSVTTMGDMYCIHNDYDVDDEEEIHEYSGSEDDATDEQESLCEALREWAVKKNVTHAAVSSLLKILHPYHPSLPVTANTLLKSGEPSMIVRLCSGGEYVHFGILNGLKYFENDILKLKVEMLECQVNIDGLPCLEAPVCNCGQYCVELLVYSFLLWLVLSVETVSH